MMAYYAAEKSDYVYDLEGNVWTGHMSILTIPTNITILTHCNYGITKPASTSKLTLMS